MKTLTVTIVHTTNYGAVLQAYALQQSILSTGAENTLLDYRRNDNKLTCFHFVNFIKDPVKWAKNVASQLVGLFNLRAISKKKKSFLQFEKTHLSSSKCYTTIDGLKKDPPEADVYFTGSDQVWRFSEGEKFIEACYLNFGQRNVRKCSYAASMEKMNYTDEQKAHVREWLGSFSKISLREQSAADYINSITGYSTCRVLDPVFLLQKEQWLKISKPREIKGPYILCYQVQSAPRMQEIVNQLKMATGYRTVAVLPYATKWIKTDDALYDVSPQEFLYLMSKAEIVVAASFHGVAFGMEFGKVVYGTSRDGYSERIKGIMDLLGAGDFYISEKSIIPNASDYPIDLVNKRLFEERGVSKSYLLECLKMEDANEK